MLELQISREKVRGNFALVENRRFQQSWPVHWKVDDAGRVQPQSVLWLFCWAKTGMGSPRAAEHCQEIFGSILDITFGQFDRRVEHEWARKHRYSSKSGELESELTACLLKN